MTIAVEGAASLLVTNGSGQRTGFVAGSEEPVEEIPGATFFFDGLRDVETQGPVERVVSSFQIASAGVGAYTVRVIGIEGGSFTLTVDLIGSDGSLTPPASMTGAIAPNEVKTFVVRPGSGGMEILSRNTQ
jgi:hypothetical protein